MIYQSRRIKLRGTRHVAEPSERHRILIPSNLDSYFRAESALGGEGDGGLFCFTTTNTALVNFACRMNGDGIGKCYQLCCSRVFLSRCMIFSLSRVDCARCEV